MEILSIISDGNDPFNYTVTAQNLETTAMSNDDIMLDVINKDTGEQPMDVRPDVDAESDLSPVLVVEPSARAVTYLLRCYMNVTTEERQHPKKSSLPPLSGVLLDLRTSLVRHLVLILQGKIFAENPPRISLLTSYILTNGIPRGLMPELAEQTYSDQSTFNCIFIPILRGVMEAMQKASVADQEHVRPLEALGELAELRCGPSHTIRPVAGLIASLPDFNPEPCSAVPGREIAKTSFLGSFFSVSLFSEENPKLADKIFSGANGVSGDKSLAFALQQDIEHTRMVLHGTCHAMLLSPARVPLLQYFANILKHNEKRTQLQSEEKSLAGEKKENRQFNKISTLTSECSFNTVCCL